MTRVNLADHLLDSCRRAAAAWPRGCAEVLEALAWMTDSDPEIPDAVDSWLRSDDRERVRVALAIEDWFPFRYFDEMVSVLNEVKARWPELSAECDQIIERRKRLGEKVLHDPTSSEDASARLERSKSLLKRMRE